MQASAAEAHAMSRFFTAHQFFVIGASANHAKFGNKVLRWYLDQRLPVIPVHPSAPSIEGINAIKTLEDASLNMKASVSVVTPPAISLSLLQRYAHNKEIEAFWLQPGAADAPVIVWLRSQPQDIQNKVVFSGACILVQGPELLHQQRGTL